MNALAKEKQTLYDFKILDIDGKLVDLYKFGGKPILLVNTASRCGYTPQYEGLQRLFLDYRKTDFTIIATTSNSFNQEYSTADDIKKICLVNYDVGFIVSSPVNVKGDCGWEPPVSNPGDFVQFRAVIDCIFAMSACPQDLVPINAGNPVEAHFQIFN